MSQLVVSEIFGSQTSYVGIVFLMMVRNWDFRKSVTKWLLQAFHTEKGAENILCSTIFQAPDKVV